MNPLDAAIKENQFPSMADVRRKLQIRWYRCPVDRSVLKELSKPDDARGFFQALGHLGLWVLTGSLTFYFFTQGQWLLFLLALFAHGTIATFFTAPQHELCHRTVFKTKWLNDAFVRVFATLAWLNFRIYQFSHNYHHRYTLFLEGDREEVLPVTPSLRALYLLQLFTLNIKGGYQSRGLIPTVRNFVNIARDRFENPFNSWGPELYAGHDKQRLKAVNWSRWVLAFHATFAVVAIVIAQPILIVIVSASPFIANWLRYFVGVPMHCGLKSNIKDFRKCARTITLDPLSEFLYWHMNWHLEHHMFAAVPCYNLKKLHQEVAADMPVPRTLIGAWKEMRDTWRRQQHDPDYAFDTPLPEPQVQVADATDPSDSLAAGLGELGPREINDKHHSQSAI